MIRYFILCADEDKAEYYTFEDDVNNIPIITLEVLTESRSHMEVSGIGVHFLTEQPNHDAMNADNDLENASEPIKTKNQFLEYMTRNDGSVICRLCGEVLQSRTHWYRHKSKVHVPPTLNPSPLFQCERCMVFFKSRKGYIGHITSRHSDVLKDSGPILSKTRAALSKQTNTPHIEIKEEPDPELVIPKTSVPNYQNNGKHTNRTSKSQENKKNHKSTNFTTDTESYCNNKSDWSEKRRREEKLVADIINRVKRECEAQGSGSAARKGYTRRTTVMHT